MIWSKFTLKTGVRVLSLECRWAMKNFAYVQFSSSRFAYSAPWCINRPEFKIFVIFVYDLKTGKQILTYRDLRVFRFNNATNFVLEKDQIIFEHDDKLHLRKVLDLSTVFSLKFVILVKKNLQYILIQTIVFTLTIM